MNEPHLFPEEKVCKKALPFLFLLGFLVILFFCSKIMGGCEPPGGRDGSPVLFGTIVNFLLLIINPALFCVFEVAQLINDRINGCRVESIFFFHMIMAGLPVVSFGLGRWCWYAATSKKQPLNRVEPPAEAEEDELSSDFPQNRTKPVQRFFRDLAIFTLIFLALAPFHSNLLEAPSKLVENARVYLFSHNLQNKPNSYQAFYDKLRLADSYANLGQYEKSFQIFNALIDETVKDKRLFRLSDIYGRILYTDHNNTISPSKWIELTSYADSKLEAICQGIKPTTNPDGSWNKSKNGSLSEEPKGAQRCLIRTYTKHKCNLQAQKWIDSKYNLQRKLLGGGIENLQSLASARRWDRSQLEPLDIYNPFTGPQMHLALLECRTAEPTEKSWSEHFRKRSIQDTLTELGQLDGTRITVRYLPESAGYHGDYYERKEQLLKELNQAEQSSNYAVARDKAREIARFIHRHYDSVSKEAAAYYNRMIKLESLAPQSKQAELQDLMEAAESNQICGNSAPAQDYLARAHTLKTSLLVKRYPGLARDLNNRALLLLRLNRIPEARLLYEQALQIDKECWGAQNKAIAVYLNNLGHICSDMKDYDQAEKYFQQALQIDERETCDKLDLGSDYENLGRLASTRGKKDLALKNLTTARNLKSQVLGPDSIEVVDLQKAITAL